MKFKALWKDTFREINKSKMRFLAILTIILLGVAFYVGISATGPDMVHTSDQYYSDLELMDYKVQSTYGLTKEDITSLEELDEMSVQSHYAYDFLLDDASSIRLYSLNTEKGQKINQYYLVEGRLPNKQGEIALDHKKHLREGTKIGDTIELDTGENGGEPEKNLQSQSFEVVGLVNSPLFIEIESRGVSSIGSGTLDSFGVISEKDYTSDFYSEAYLTIDDSENHQAYSDEYEEHIDEHYPVLEKKLNQLENRREEEIVNEAQEEIDEGWEEIEEAEQELEDAEADLNEARAEIDDGWKELEEGKDELRKETEQARNEIKENETKLYNGRAELAKNKKELIQQKENLEEKLEEINIAEKELNTSLEELNLSKEEIPKIISNLEIIRERLNRLNEHNLSDIKELTNQIEEALKEQDIDDVDAIIAQIKEAIQEQGIDDVDAIINQIKEVLEEQDIDNVDEIINQIEEVLEEQDIDDIEEIINQLKEVLEEQNIDNIEDILKEFELSDIEQVDELINKIIMELKEIQKGIKDLNKNKKLVINNLNQIDNGLAEIEKNEREIQKGIKEIEEAKNTLAAETEKAQKELDEAETELEEAEEEYEEGLTSFEKEKKDALKEIEEAKEDLNKAEKDLEKLAMPEYQSFDRSDNFGYLEYKDNADRLSVIAKVFPVFFFLIAIFISFTTMTRMVDEEREYIGIMKALGYKNRHILIKFIVYAAIATIIGSILGLVIGYTLFPTLIFYAYSSMYNFPKVLLQEYPFYTVIALIFAFVSTVGASLLAVRYSLRSNAARLLQPKPPKKGSRIWLEKINFIWDRLSFNYKITFRNVFRYKSRMLMTILGIAGSTGLILTGFGISDSIGDIPDIQYGEINKFQAYVAINPNADSKDLEEYRKESESMESLNDSIFVLQQNVQAEREGMNTQDITFFVPEKPEQMDDFIRLSTPENEEDIYQMDNSGVYLTEKIAQLLDLKIGDEFEVLNTDDEPLTANVAGIVENYMSHFAYMTPEYYTEVTGEEYKEPDVQLIKFDKEDVHTEKLGSQLMEQDAVAGIQYVDDVYDAFSGSIESLDLITQILVISAAALAFIVLYNLTNINVSERSRELSTIKVLGSYDHEVTTYIYRENIILTFLGILVGLGFGKILTDFIMDTMEIDMLVFGRNIYLSSYLYSSLLTILFSLVVMIVIHFQLKKIDMVEALKGND